MRFMTAAAVSATEPSGFVLGLACRECGNTYPKQAVHVCELCFGPLEITYDYAAIGKALTRAKIESRPATMWRYAELLPLDGPPTVGLHTGMTPLLRAQRLGERLGIADLWLKNDAVSHPTLSFKDRVVAVAVSKARELDLPIVACASTGNLANATAALAASAGIPCVVLLPNDLEAAKVLATSIYGAHVVAVRGTYDDVNRLCSEIAGKYGWGFVNVNLRPFYAEGSKTLAFEVAEGLGWRSPDVIVAPIASGAMFTKLAKGFAELADAGLIERRPIRFVGGQAAGCAPVATAWEQGTTDVQPVRTPDTFVRSLAIGNPADGRYSVEQANASGGSIEAIPDEATAAAIRQVAALEGIFSETAGGVTVAAAEAARRRGVIREGDEVVVLLTGNGLKTPDARLLGLEQGGVAPSIRPSLSAFEAWLGTRA
jgi:threonine synthase